MPPAVLLQTRVRGVTSENADGIGHTEFLSSTLRWGSWQIYDGTAVGRLVGLDYFGARYMSSAQGRFTSADPKQFSRRTLANPQKWNKYSYVLNNPLSLTDPDGMEEISVQFRSYIPQANVGPYRGDNRGPTASQSVTSRASITPNPLTPQGMTPGIKSDLTVSVPLSGNSVTTSGTVSGSPAFELNVGTPGNSTTNIPIQGASSNQSCSLSG